MFCGPEGGPLTIEKVRRRGCCRALQGSERIGEHVAGSRNRGSLVRRAEKSRLVSAGCQIDATFQALVKKPSKEFRVAFQGRRIVPHWRVGKEDTEHRSALRDLYRNSLGPAGRDYGVPQLAAKGIEPAIRILFRQEIEPGDASGHRERIAAQRTRLVNRSLRREQIHDGRAPAKRPNRKPAADDFAETGEV